MPLLEIDGIIPQVPVRRTNVIASVLGLEGSGKTAFALSGLYPTVYISTEASIEQGYTSDRTPIIDLMEDGRVEIYYIPVSNIYSKLTVEKLEQMDGSTTVLQEVRSALSPEELKHHVETADRFQRIYYAALKAPVEQVPTVVVDSMTRIYPIMRIVNAGKFEQVMQKDHGGINNAMGDLFNAAKESGKNVIFISHIKPKWMGGQVVEGQWDIHGWPMTRQNVFVEVMCERIEKPGAYTTYKQRIMYAKHAPQITGDYVPNGDTGAVDPMCGGDLNGLKDLLTF